VGVATSAVEKQDGVIGVAGSIAVGFAERKVVELQLGKRFTAAEMKIFHDIIAVLGGPLPRRRTGLSVRGHGRK
jgi:hypothetical protein